MERRKEITQDTFDRLVLDYCYSRELCRGLGLDYNNIGTREVDCIREYLSRDYIIKPAQSGTNEQ